MSYGEVIDDRHESYRMVGDVLCHVAQRTGVTIDEVTARRWKGMMGLLREFDTLADEHLTGPGEAIGALRDFSKFEKRYPELTRSALGESTHRQMVDQVRTILYLGNLMATEEDPDRFILLRETEAYHTVQLLGAATTDAVREQPMFTTLMWRFCGMGVAANLGDTLLDARADYTQGRTQLKPSLYLYAALLRAGAHHSRDHWGPILDTQAFVLRGKILLHRARNRYRNGLQPYSTLTQIRASVRRRDNQ